MARLWFARLLLLLGLLWLGCTSDLPVVQPPPPPDGPVKVAFQGAPGNGSTNAALPPIRVAVLDAHDRVVPRDSMLITLRLAPNPGAATLRGTLTVPTQAGIAEFAGVRIDQAAEGYRLIAEVATLSSDTSSAFNVVAVLPVKVAFQGDPRDGITTAALPPIRVAVLDAQDSVVLRDSINITVRLAPSPGAATLRGTLTRPTREGIAEFTDLLIDQAADGYRLIAEVSTLTSDTSSSFSMAAPRPFEKSVIAASTASTCALDPSGAAWCWGDNMVGQLGEGRLLSSLTPVPIVGNLRFSQITVDPGIDDAINDDLTVSIACGLTVSGVIHCWGGAGSAFDGADGSTPTAISGSRTFSSIDPVDPSCGLAPDSTVWCWPPGSHEGPKQLATDLRFASLALNCGLTGAGKAYCWGSGPLGDGQWHTNDSPVPVSGDHVFRLIAGGDGHHCGVDDVGVTWCWGGAQHPFRGDGSGEIDALVPVRLPGDHVFRSLSAAGSGTCGLEADGRVWCWGDTIALMSGVPPFAKISAGLRAFCALTADGEAWCGRAPVPTTERFASISVGLRATCAITTDGEGRCWGYNNAGQLADGHPLRSPAPVRVAGGKTFESLSGGGNAMCGLTSSDETWCWGAADSVGARSTPARLVGDPRFKTVSLAHVGGCGIDANGQGWCWGYGRIVATGDPYANAGKPVPILGNTRLSAIAVGEDACALTTGGDVYCAGPVYRTLTLLPGGRKFVALSGGSEVHCGLTAAGDPYCWTYIEHQPLLLPGGLHLTTISANGGLVCGVTTDRKGYCWQGGGNRYPPLVWRAPEPVPGDLTFTSIVVGDGSGHICGTTPDGTIYCWGSNRDGQLGNGKMDTVTVTIPTPVVGLRARQP